MHHKKPENQIIKRGELFGLINLLTAGPALFFLSIALQAQWAGRELNTGFFSLLLACALVLILAQVYFMLGIKAFAEKIKRADISHFTSMFIDLSVVEYALILLANLAGHNNLPILAGALVLIAVPVTAMLGLFMIQISEALLSLPARVGKLGTRIAFFESIAGYMTTTVILAPVGGLLFFVAKFYMWQLLRQESNFVQKSIEEPSNSDA